MMPFHVIIPARYSSSRLPGKPLVDLAGKPMVQHVVERALLSKAATVTVATDDQRIFDVVKNFGGIVVMTRPTHESGTDRLQEVAQILNFTDQDIVVNVQGDEPLIAANAINQVAANLANNTAASVATLCESITNISDVNNPNFVKVAISRSGMALYFSRAAIPFDRDGNDSVNMNTSIPYFRHIGLYAYRVKLLHEFVTWPLGILEAAEKLEQLRVLENGYAIHIEQTCEPFEGGVDTPADVKRVVKKLLGEL